ncbi:unnamed protein product, partial [Pylaiella littoralis]
MACESMRDSIQGLDFDDSVDSAAVGAAVATAAAAASTAQAAVTEAVSLLDKHRARLSDGTKSSRAHSDNDRQILSKLTPLLCEMTPSVSRAVEDGLGHCWWKEPSSGCTNGLDQEARRLSSSPKRSFRPLKPTPSVHSAAGGGVLARILGWRTVSGSGGDGGRRFGDEWQDEFEERGVDCEVKDQGPTAGGVTGDWSSAEQDADVYWAALVAQVTAEVAAESAERAASAAAAYERRRGAGHGGGGRYEVEC